jgi:ATP-dependent RNA helicase DeaD
MDSCHLSNKGGIHLTMSETETKDVDALPTEYVADIGFDDMGMSPELRRGVSDRGYTSPTPVQAKAFKPAAEGRDLIVRSKTGTGKTCAFGLPVLQRIENGERRVRALILCPTRELALQVSNELTELAKYKDVHVAAIYGGASMKQQEDALTSGSAVVVGTPGRVFDHINRGNLKLQDCQTVVLDEADEMLNQGFYEDVTRILDCLPKNRQVLLFSATVPEDIQRLIHRYTQSPETLLLSGDVFTVEHIHHIRYDVSDAFPKPRHLIYVLEHHNPDNAIIFCNTRDDTELVTAVLNRNGFDTELLNGDLPQKERERVMAKIKRGEVAFMVATDLAARGIDISDLGHVINYSLPEDPAVYLHRVGRTGRIGKKGTAINLTSGKELATLTALERKYQVKFEKRPVPSPEEAMRLWSERHIKEIREASGSSVYEGFFGLAAHVKHRPDADDLIAFLLKYFFQHHRVERVNALKEAPREEPRKPRSEKPRREKTTRGEGREVRPERPRREKRPEEPVPEGQVKLWINLGKEDGLDASQLQAVLTSLGVPEGRVKAVHLRGNYSYLFVAEEDVAAHEAVMGKNHNNKTIKMERARKAPAA